MTLEHVAIWTNHLERLKDFYEKFLGGIANEKYVNTTNQFESYFLSFKSGARLELMQKTGIPENRNDSRAQYLGIIHLAFAVDTKKEVDEKAEAFRREGFVILKGPRKTGDGYYEFETLDPDNNRLEITARWVD
jgi:lactoylglutathione lyase